MSAASVDVDWAAETERYLTCALNELRNGEDPVATIECAAQAARILLGEQAADTMDRLPEPACTCPPELVDRGGWTSTCRADIHTGREVAVEENS